jgi:hypothetical protein
MLSALLVVKDNLVFSMYERSLRLEVRRSIVAKDGELELDWLGYWKSSKNASEVSSHLL